MLAEDLSFKLLKLNKHTHYLNIEVETSVPNVS
jgi:hypothetical protein